MPTPVGPAPRDPNDPDLWDWGDDPFRAGEDDPSLLALLARRRRRRRLWALFLAVLVVAFILASTL